MSDKVDKLLDSALDEFEEAEEEKIEVHDKTIKEELAEIGENINASPEVEAMFNALAEELENNSEIRDQLEKVGQDLFTDGVLKESMIDIRDRLKDYIQRMRHMIPKKDLSRYEIQLKTYNDICSAIEENKEKVVMELISKLSLHGELPEELLPHMHPDCSII